MRFGHLLLLLVLSSRAFQIFFYRGLVGVNICKMICKEIEEIAPTEVVISFP